MRFISRDTKEEVSFTMTSDLAEKVAELGDDGIFTVFTPTMRVMRMTAWQALELYFSGEKRKARNGFLVTTIPFVQGDHATKRKIA